MKKKFEKRTKLVSGFTLLEIIFGISIFVIIMGAITLFSRNVWIYNSFISAGLGDADNARRALKTMTAEIRTASAADTGSYAISLATTTAFTFYADIDSDGLKERVRYFLSGSLLQKGITKPTGSPLSYNPINEKISTVVTNITSNSVFNYYDKNFDGTTPPLGTPVNIASIRLVKITITIDRDPNRAPVPTTFSTQISIRNLKDNL